MVYMQYFRVETTTQHVLLRLIVCTWGLMRLICDFHILICQPTERKKQEQLKKEWLWIRIKPKKGQHDFVHLLSPELEIKI